MQKNVTGFLKALLAIGAAIASGTLAILTFPPFELSFLAWFALVPLLVIISGKSIKYGFFLALICGGVFFLGIFNWILEVPKYTHIHHAILALYLGSYYGVFGVAFCLIAGRLSVTLGLLAAPFIWVSLEYVRSNMSFMALPWGLLAHSQYQHPAVIQIASFTGAYGITFLIVLVNSALAVLTMSASYRFSRGKFPRFQPLSQRLGKALILAGAVCVTLSLVYGYKTIASPIKGKAIKVSVVQGNILQKRKWDEKYAPLIMKTYAGLTEEAAKDNPDLIVWPETATPRSINKDRGIYREVRRIACKTSTYLLIGSSLRQKFRTQEPGPNIKYFNSAFLIDPERGIPWKQRYHKIRLFPFGEYLPYKDTFPWASIKVPKVGGYLPGKESTVFEHPDFRFGVTICWENIFSDLFRQFVKRGAQFMVNITNEAWFGKTAAPYQFVSMSVFRAVENRVFVVRCANTGISCFIDTCGRIFDRLKDKNGVDIFIQGVLTAPVIPLTSGSFYTRYGDWLAWLCFPCSMVFLFFALFIKSEDVNLTSQRHK